MRRFFGRRKSDEKQLSWSEHQQAAIEQAKQAQRVGTHTVRLISAQEIAEREAKAKAKRRLQVEREPFDPRVRFADFFRDEPTPRTTDTEDEVRQEINVQPDQKRKFVGTIVRLPDGSLVPPPDSAA